MCKDKQLKIANMKNQNIGEFLTTYVNNPEPGYAVLVKGPWGCGKTFFINNWLESYSTPKGDYTEDDIVLEPIYVSLYGKTSIDQITKDIDKALHPILYSKVYKVVKNVFKVAGKIALKTSFDLDNDGKEETSFTSTLDSLSIFSSDDKSIKGCKFLIFDDLERCNIEMKTLLGYINYFVEHCDCHVIIIGDVTKAPDDAKKILGEFTEKTVGREFVIEPDTETAIDYFLKKEVPVLLDLTKYRDWIISVFQATKCQNLRILRQCIYDFKCIYQELDSKLLKKDKTLIKEILGSFIVVYCEYRGLKQDVLKQWKTNYQNGMSFAADAKNEISNLQRKYLAWNENINVLNPDYVEMVMAFILKGQPIKENIEQLLSYSQVQENEYDRLAQFYDMDDKRFIKDCDKVSNDIQKNKITNPYSLGRTIAMLSFFAKREMYSVKPETIDAVKRWISDAISQITSKNELYRHRGAFYNGINSYMLTEEKEIAKGILSYYQNEFTKKDAQLLNQLEETLKTLDEENVPFLCGIDKSSLPDNSTPHSLRATFSNIDVNDFFNRICSLSNKDRMIVCDFLSQHYYLASGVDFAQNYKPDEEFFIKLKELVKEKVTTSTAVGKYTYEHLLRHIDACCKRCSGNQNAQM